MRSFLENLADSLLYAHGDDLSRVTVIFPNRRAGLYLKQILKQKLDRTGWSPRVISLRELIESESDYTLPDPLTLVYHLHKAYIQVMKSDESFEDFYYWGQMLIKDFDEVDKYLVNPRILYSDLRKQKELDLTFEFLTEEQREIIARFWKNMEERDSKSKQRFLSVWRHLYEVYSAFQKRLHAENMSYEGAMFRDLVDKLSTHNWKSKTPVTWFAGFNALTRSEEILITHFLQNFDSRIFWDMDKYYLNSWKQEAGRFFREYRDKSAFSSSFTGNVPSTITGEKKDVEIIGVSQYVGQAKVSSMAVQQFLEVHPYQDLRKVAIILAEESLLLPVLHSLPDQIDKVNVTMGFPLSFAPLSSLIELVIELVELSRTVEGERLFHFRTVGAFLSHPLMRNFGSDNVRDEIDSGGRLYYAQDQLVSDALTKIAFGSVGTDFLSYVIQFLEELTASSDFNDVENSYTHHYLTHLLRYRELVKQEVSVVTFRKLFRQLVRMDKVPFTGEPLEGIQVMGVLETRNIDFEVIFVLGMNEEAFPGGKGQHSYIPYNLRRAYELPHFDQQDAIYAYLFYRLFHHAKYARLYYNTEGNDLGGEEMSRFLKQLIYEKPFKVQRKVLSNIPDVLPEVPISASGGMRSLERYFSGDDGSSLSPSAINTFLDCKLKFYYSYVARLRVHDEMDDSLDARTLGLLIHECMEKFYEPFLGKIIYPIDISSMENEIEAKIDDAFRKVYKIKEGEKFSPEGKNLVARDVAVKFVSRILKVDMEYAPFEVVGLEKKYERDFDLSNGKSIKLGGTIDRIDRKDGRLRILDYKTGGDELKFSGFEDLFNSKKRKKAAFQTMFYTLMYPGNERGIIPSVYNKGVLFQSDSWKLFDKSAKAYVENFASYREEYEKRLGEVLEELFDPNLVFEQTEDTDMCKRCDFNGVCQRGFSSGQR